MILANDKLFLENIIAFLLDIALRNILDICLKRILVTL